VSGSERTRRGCSHGVAASHSRPRSPAVGLCG
jgi:hypothetical protein